MENKFFFITGLSAAMAVLIADYSDNPADSFFNDAHVAHSSYIGLHDRREVKKKSEVLFMSSDTVAIDLIGDANNNCHKKNGTRGTHTTSATMCTAR